MYHSKECFIYVLCMYECNCVGGGYVEGVSRVG